MSPFFKPSLWCMVIFTVWCALLPVFLVSRHFQTQIDVLPNAWAPHSLRPTSANTHATAGVGPRRPCRSTSYRADDSLVQCNVEKEIPSHDAYMPAGWKRSRSETVVVQSQPYNRSESLWMVEQLSCCAVSDAYRVIYVKVAKSASSSTLPGYLRPAICPVKPGEQGAFVVYETAFFSPSCTGYEFEPRTNDCYPCHDIPRWKWQEYYVFSVVREPYDRAQSSYVYCRKAEAGVTFADWCVNPDKGGGYCGSIPDAPNIHWSVQSNFLCNNQKQCIVDFVARAESLSGDLDVVVQAINAGRNTSYPPLPLYSTSGMVLNKNRPSTRYDLLDQPENAHCRGALSRWYAPDFALLGYDP